MSMNTRESRLDADPFGPAKDVLTTFDAFPKTKRTYLARSKSGHHWTILLCVMTVYLISTEFYRWLSGTVTHNFAIEKGIGHEMQLNLDIVIPMECDDLRVNLRDVAGDHVSVGMVLKKDPTMWSQWGRNADRSVHKLITVSEMEMEMERERKRAEIGGTGGGSGAAPPQGDSEKGGADVLYGKGLHEDVHDYLSLARSASTFPKTPRLRKGKSADSCRIYGSFELNKVRGNLHITPRGYAYAEFSPPVQTAGINISHQINELSFGPFYPQLVNPLDKSVTTTEYHHFRYQYFLSLVPTIYTTDSSRLDKVLAAAAVGAGSGTTDDHYGQLLQEKYRAQGVRNPLKSRRLKAHTVFTNQYSVTQQSRELSTMYGGAVPGIFFTYDFEPIMLLVVEQKSSFLGMLIRLVNVMSGVAVGLGWCAQLTDWVAALWSGRTARASGILTGQMRRGIDDDEHKGE